MHSGKVEDVCGVCGGNGSTCHLISNTYSGGNDGGKLWLDIFIICPLFFGINIKHINLFFCSVFI